MKKSLTAIQETMSIPDIAVHTVPHRCHACEQFTKIIYLTSCKPKSEIRVHGSIRILCIALLKLLLPMTWEISIFTIVGFSSRENAIAEGCPIQLLQCSVKLQISGLAPPSRSSARLLQSPQSPSCYPHASASTSE